MIKLFDNILSLFFPELCIICGENLTQGEQHICKRCLTEIPRTNYHLINNNPVEKKFWGKVPVYRGTAFYFFTKGSPFQKVLHELKYKDNKEVGKVLAKYAAADLLESPDFSSVDLIIPVPLHPKKLKIRGYNQSDWIGMGLSEILGCPLNTTSLIRKKENTTQTKKSVFERFENTAGIFELVNADDLRNKHVLIVDDVLTTGSTIEAVINALQIVPGIKVSIFTLAVA